MQILELIQHLGTLSTFIPIFIGLFLYRFLETDHKIILYFLSLVLCFDAFLYITMQYGISNSVIVHIFTILEFLFISTFYLFNLNKFISIKPLILINVLILLFILFVSFIITPTYVLDSISRVIEYFSFIFLSFLLIFKISFSDSAIKISKTSIIINFVFLNYFSLSFIIFLFGNIISGQTLYIIWVINGSLTILTNVLIAFALWKARPQMKS